MLCASIAWLQGDACGPSCTLCSMLWRKKTNSCASDCCLAQEAVSRGWDRVLPGPLGVCGCPSVRHLGPSAQPFCPRPTRSQGLPTGWQQAVVHGCSLPSWLLLSPILQNSYISLFQSGSFCCFFRKWWCLLRRSGSLGEAWWSSVPPSVAWKSQRVYFNPFAGVQSVNKS